MGGGGTEAGGFLGGFGSMTSPSKAGLSVVDRKSTMPVTCHMLSQIRKEKDETYYWQEFPLSSITLVGQIESVQETSTARSYTVSDGTGVVEVKVWSQSGGNAQQQQQHQQQQQQQQQGEFDAGKRHEWREGVYVRIYGNIRSWNQTESIAVFRMQAVTDFNEITMHMLDVAHKTMMLKKGTQVSGQLSAAPMGMGMMGSSSMAVGGAGPSGPQQTVLRAIISFCRDHPDAQNGISRRDLAQSLGGQIPMAEINHSINELLESNMIYSTIDEDHFRSIDS